MIIFTLVPPQVITVQRIVVLKRKGAFPDIGKVLLRTKGLCKDVLLEIAFSNNTM